MLLPTLKTADSGAGRLLLLSPANKPSPMEISHSILHIYYNDGAKANHV